jgi:hypothetical protein
VTKGYAVRRRDEREREKEREGEKAREQSTGKKGEKLKTKKKN